jgi:hypothetical protein
MQEGGCAQNQEECDLETMTFSLVPSQSRLGVLFSPVRRGLG